MKRKRKSNATSPSSQKAHKSSSQRPNPFLLSSSRQDPVTDQHNDGFSDNEILRHLQQFVSATSQPGNDKGVVGTVGKLLLYLESEDTVASSHSLVSRRDVAATFLPWATKHLLHIVTNQDNPEQQPQQQATAMERLFWETILHSLNVFYFEAGDSHGHEAKRETASILTQSALNKLVPYFAAHAVTSVETTAMKGHDNKMTSQECAAKCFERLTDLLYRPTMDLACTSLLASIQSHVESFKDDDISATLLVSRECAQVILSTTSLLRKLQRLGVASPKKIFNLLASIPVLLSLSRLYNVQVSEVESTLLVKNSQELIRELLWEGLFNPSNHIDGFYSMPMPVPTFGASNDDERRMDVAAESISREEEEKAPIHCYQENLVGAMQDMLLNSSTDGDSEEQLTVAAAHLAPVLLKVFIRATKEWENRQSSSSGASRRGKKRLSAMQIADLQFRFWFNAMAYPTVTYLSKSNSGSEETSRSLNLSLLRSLGQCLCLLLEHDVYLPSYEDNESHRFDALDWVARSVLNYMTENVVSEINADEVNEIVYIFQYLIRLNHLLVHERLSQVFTLSIHRASHLMDTIQYNPTFRGLSELFLTVINTYEKLRQLEHLLNAFLRIVDTMQEFHDTEEEQRETQPQDREATLSCSLKILSSLACEHSFMQALSFAIRNCPHGQIQSLFDSLNTWIALVIQPLLTACEDAACIPSQSHHTTKQAMLRIIIRLFILVIRNVRVDKHTALNVSRNCQESLKTSAFPLLKEDSSGSTDSTNSQNAELTRGALLNCGLVLTGWLVDLQTRCDFWLGRNQRPNEEAPDSEEISTILENAMQSIRSDANNLANAKGARYAHLLGELQFLACHRIQYLYSRIHDQSQIEEEASSELVSEARRLVNFAIQIACDRSLSGHRKARSDTEFPLHLDSGPSHSRWTILARTISLWAPYATATHVKSFLNWLFSTFAAHDEKENQTKSATLSALPCGEAVVRDAFACEQLVTISLLKDASFFEVGAIAIHFVSVGYTYVLQLLQESFRDAVISATEVSPQNTIVFNGANLLSAPDSPSWTLLSGKDLTNLFSTEEVTQHNPIEMDSVRVDEVIRGFRVLKILNSSPRTPHNLFGPTTELDVALRLDRLSWLLHTHCTPSQTEIRAIVIQIACAARRAASRALSNEITPWIAVSDRSCLRTIMVGLCRSTTEMISSCCSKDRNHLLLATGQFFDAIFSHCLLMQTSVSGQPQTFARSFDDLLRLSSDVAEKRVLVHLARFVVKRVVTARGLYQQLTAQSDQAIQPVFLSPDVFVQLIQSVHRYLWKFMVAQVEIAQMPGVATRDTQVECVVLLGDTIRLVCMHECAINQKQRSEIFTNARGICKSVLEMLCESSDDVDSGLSNGVMYFLASAFGGNRSLIEEAWSSENSTAMLDILQHQFVASRGQPTPLMDAALSGIVRNLDTDLLRSFLHQMLQLTQASHRAEATMCSVHVLTIVLLSTKDCEQRKLVSECFPHLVPLSLHLFAPNAGWRNCSSGACVRVATKAIHAVMESKDVVVLKERDIAMILSSVNASLGSENHLQTTNNDVYIPCCSLVSSLLQRFPKQLYACAPSLTSAMQSLFIGVISGSVPELELTMRTQQFTRICELLSRHKEVFKKHVLGIVLEFIHALKTELDPSLKDSVLPALYHILDMMSEFETKQLNALMDVTGKALFRSVYHGYQKRHIYRGQY